VAVFSVLVGDIGMIRDDGVGRYSRWCWRRMIDVIRHILEVTMVSRLRGELMMIDV